MVNSNIRAISFDCYGTLIDWESGILSALSPVLTKHGVEVEGNAVLEAYAKIESTIEAGPYKPYRLILHEAMAGLGKALSFEPSQQELSTLHDSLKNWPPFNDTVRSLEALHRHFKLAIFSNIDDGLFTLSNKHLKVEFDYIITAAQVGAYKPSLSVFNYALEKTGYAKDEVLHVAQSLYHDHVPAKKLGFNTVWINRRKGITGSGATPEATATPDLEFPDLASFVQHIETVFQR